LFFENLLDQDCYLDWYLSSLESASLDTLPIWLLMLGIYWDHLVRFRKRGRRLVELLLEKIRQVCGAKLLSIDFPFINSKIRLQGTTMEPKELLRPLIDRVSLLVRRLSREQTSSVVLPRSWDQYQDVVSSCLYLDEPTENAIFQSLLIRNTRVRQAKDYHKATQRSPQQQIIQLLDAARSVSDVTSLSDACLGTMADREALISELLEWTGTPFRQGLVRIYITVRLLRKWKRLGIDVDAHILSFLAKSRDRLRREMTNIYHVVVELVRSQTFSVGRYLQWLVARGAVERYRQEEFQRVSSAGKYGSASQSTGTSLPGDIELLSQLPVNRLPQHLRNLRDTLLARAGLALSEDDVIRSVKADIKQRLPAVFGTEIDGDDAMVCHNDHHHLNWSVKSEIGQWVRRGVAEHYKDGAQFVAGSSGSSVEISSLTLDEFVTVRNTLESFGDLSMLADVLSDAANSNDVLVLASAVDTLNRHFDCFCVIGALNDLFKSFFEAFVRVKQSGLPVYDLVFSLVELGHRLPGEVNAVIILRQELFRADRRFALAASSPVSDHMVETLNDANPSLSDDLDQFLGSGNSMDENMLAMVFQKLSQQLEVCDDGGKFPASAICRHLVQLRSFNPKHFDLLLIRWIDGMLKSPARPKLSTILAPLVGIGCVTLPAFAVMMKKLMHSESTRSAVPQLAELQLDLLELFVPDSDRGSCTDVVRFKRANLLHISCTDLLFSCHTDSGSRRKSFCRSIRMRLWAWFRVLSHISPRRLHSLALTTCDRPWITAQYHFFVIFSFGTLSP
jgi:mediator of RNA polymerase II transcription subunit 12